MKLQLLHGSALSSSRAKLLNIKKEFDPQEVVIYDGEYDLGEVKANLMTSSLFSDQRLVILENPDENFQFPISSFQFPLTLILWFDHEVSQTKPIMEWVKSIKGEIFFFPEGKEVSVFPFLDLLAEGKKSAFLELDKLKKANFEIQYFITMVFYLLRSLAVTPKNAPQFVKQKLERQRKNFPLEKIKDFYKEIIEIDFRIKSGLLEKDQAEFLLVNKFIF